MQRLILAMAALAAVLATARLGMWQLDRAAQKAAAQERLDAQASLPPLGPAQLASSPDAAAAQHQRRATLEGRWLADRTIYLDNRQMDGRPGFYVVTPLLLDDGSAVLVQRGWAPRDFVDRARVPAVPSGAPPVVVSGRIAPPPARLFQFDPGESGPIRQNLEPETYAREIGVTLRPFTLLQMSDAPDGLQRRWPSPALDVDRNYGYAFQWFALAALIAGLYVWFQLLKPWLGRS